MCGRVLISLAVFCVFSSALAQQGQAPEPSRSESAQPKGLVKRPPEPPPSVDASGRKIGRISLDVSVTDQTGKPLPGLQQDDFAVFDNHQQMALDSFHASGLSEVVLVVDAVNNTFQSVATARDQISKFLSLNGGRLPVPVSIVLFSDSGAKIDQPTQDGNLLAAELKKMPVPIHTLTSAMGGEGVLERFQRSLKILTQMITYEKTKPGRKLMIWIGSGWPMLASTSFGSSVSDRHAYWEGIVSFSTDLREARVTLYNIVIPNSEGNVLDDLAYRKYLKPVTAAKDADSANLALPVLAIQSGGRVLTGSNDVAGEIASCVAEASSFYMIAFPVSPSEKVNDYRPLEVRLRQPGLTARTNGGYYSQPYAESPPVEAHKVEIPPAEAQTAAPVATLRKEVRLVVVDAVVLDKKGAPVKGLKASDFQLKEDGTPQKIASVEEHGGEERRPVGSESAAQVSGTSAATDGTISASNKPINKPATWNVLLVDQFNTLPADQASMLRQLKQFVKQLPADEPVALAVMSSQLKLLVPFADGAGAIARFLDKNGLPPTSTLEPSNIRERGEAGQASSAETAAVEAQTQELTARTDIDRQGQHAQKTLENFSALAKWLTPYPGRKNVYWLSAGFPLQGQAFNTQGIGLKNTGAQTVPIQAITDKELESARVAIYPIDARGVAPPDYEGITTADTSGSVGGSGVLGEVSKKNQLSAAQMSGMLEIAKATGGVATFNNDIAKTLRNDFNQSENYYTISYTPANTDWNGGYRKVQLSLEEPGTQLIYRQGYYAKEPQVPPAPTKEEFRQALGHGAAAATDVLFSAKVSKTADAANVEYVIDPRTIEYQADVSGQLAAAADCAIVEYDGKGKPIATSLVRLTSTVSPERRAALNVDGLRAKQSIALKPGAASVVLGVRDQATGRFGNLEVALAGR